MLVKDAPIRSPGIELRQQAHYLRAQRARRKSSYTVAFISGAVVCREFLTHLASHTV